MGIQNPIRQGLAIAVILLFIGIALAPSINANVNTDDELVEITTEIYGMDGIKPHTVKLTKQEAQELERLFGDIKARLDKSETQEETIAIFNDTVVELDKYELLGDLNIEEAQKLVNGRFYNIQIRELLDKMSRKYQKTFDENENFLCSISGETTYTGFVPTLPLLISAGILVLPISIWLISALIESILGYMNNPILEPLLNLIYMLNTLAFWAGIMLGGGCLALLIFPAVISPIKLSSIMTFGELRSLPDYNEWFPAKGWVHTSGLLGIKNWEEKMYGKYKIPVFFGFTSYYTGVIGFTGIKLSKSTNHFYLGHAIGVKLDSSPY